MMPGGSPAQQPAQPDGTAALLQLIATGRVAEANELVGRFTEVKAEADARVADAVAAEARMAEREKAATDAEAAANKAKASHDAQMRREAREAADRTADLDRRERAVALREAECARRENASRNIGIDLDRIAAAIREFQK